ncbi:MAG: UDP-N-acetylmuramate--L-alanine ligase [Bacteroidota bacterium]
MLQCEYIYLIGVGGIGMSSMAQWYRALGKHVFGYDRTPTAITDYLATKGIKIVFNTDEQHIPQEIIKNKAESLIIYTPAIPVEHPLLRYFNRHGYRVCKRIDVLERITQRYKTVAVAGTHGKTITTALVSHILHQANCHMVAFVGGVVKGYDANLLMHGSDHEDVMLVIEADEYDRFFLRLHADICVVTSMDADHLNIYGDVQQYQEAFRQFVASTPPYGYAVVHEAVARRIGIHHMPGSRAKYYALEGKEIRAENVCVDQGLVCFDYVSNAVRIDGIQLPLVGTYNVENTLAAITTCHRLGLASGIIREGIRTFQGVERRFEFIFRDQHTVFISDYAHHPVEITAALRAARALYPHKRITAVFQPHLYSRTRDFAREFAQSLDLADQVCLLAIYPAREEPIAGVTSELIMDYMQVADKALCASTEVINQLTQWGKPEVLMLMGAGDINKLIDPLKAFLST